MSLVNAVHVLIEVAAGRRNLSGVAADELHVAVDAEQPLTVAPDPTIAPDALDSPPESTTSPSTSPEGASWQS